MKLLFSHPLCFSISCHRHRGGTVETWTVYRAVDLADFVERNAIIIILRNVHQTHAPPHPWPYSRKRQRYTYRGNARHRVGTVGGWAGGIRVVAFIESDVQENNGLAAHGRVRFGVVLWRTAIFYQNTVGCEFRQTFGIGQPCKRRGDYLAVETNGSKDRTVTVRWRVVVRERGPWSWQ